MTKRILCLDVGTVESGYVIMDYNPFTLYEFGKINNEELLDIVKSKNYEVLVYEEFQCYGMPIGKSTIQSITWNGRYIQSALDRGITVDFIYRAEEKMSLCNSMKAKDSNIRQALIDRFANFDFKNGKGTAKNKDVFYGVTKDVWSAIAIGVTYYEKNK